MARGRKKNSNSLKVLRGTDQPCRMTADVIGFSQPVDIPSVAKFKLSPLAKAIYRDCARDLIACKVLDSVALPQLVAYAKEMAIYFELSITVDEEGYTVERETKAGTITVVNPNRTAALAALAMAKSIASEFGFTPASKSHIASLTAPKTKDDNEFLIFREV